MDSSSRRDRDWSWFTGVLMKAGSSRTNVVNLANAIHRDSIGMRLDRTAGWTSQVFSAIERWPADMAAWAEWESIYADVSNPEHDARADQFVKDNWDRLLAGAELLWPAREDLLTLMKSRAEDGHQAFEREKQSRPINPEACEWPEEYFDDHIWFDDWPTVSTLRVMALDPSKGKDARRGDYSSFCMLQVTGNTPHFDFDLARRPASRIVTDGLELFLKFRPDAIAIESVQFQELLGSEFLQAFERAGVVNPPIYLLGNNTNKQMRIRTLGPLLAQRRFKVRHSPGSSLTIEQMRDFPDKGSHDDGPDSAEMAVRMANYLAFGPQNEGTIERAVA